MDLRGPKSWEHALRGMVADARVIIRRDHIPPLYRSGVKYVEEEKGLENWQTPIETMERGLGDCEDVAIWRTAELQNKGIKAQPKIIRTGPKKFHVVVRHPSGRTEDPTKILKSKGLSMPTPQSNLLGAPAKFGLRLQIKTLPNGWYAAKLVIPAGMSEIQVLGAGPTKADALERAATYGLAAIHMPGDAAYEETKSVGFLPLAALLPMLAPMFSQMMQPGAAPGVPGTVPGMPGMPGGMASMMQMPMGLMKQMLPMATQMPTQLIKQAIPMITKGLLPGVMAPVKHSLKALKFLARIAKKKTWKKAKKKVKKFFKKFKFWGLAGLCDTL